MLANHSITDSKSPDSYCLSSVMCNTELNDNNSLLHRTEDVSSSEITMNYLLGLQVSHALKPSTKHKQHY